MRERELGRLLRELRAPGEEGAAERAWQVVRAAFAGREPVPRRRRPPAAVLAVLAVGAVAAAVAVSPAGSWIRDTIGRDRVVGVSPARPALTSLPSAGRLLVVSRTGVWVVRRDGSRRFLGPYEGASWSPAGLFVVAWRGRELAALEPGETESVRWSLSRGRIADARWTGRPDDTRIAYRSGTSLRVVAGDGTGDRRLAARVAPLPPAWRPGNEYVLAYAGGDGRAAVVATDSGETLWRTPSLPPVLGIAWTSDGSRLLVASAHAIRVYDRRGRRRPREEPAVRAGVLAAASARPGSREIAYATYRATAGEGRVYLGDRLLFAGQGRFSNLVWSPDGRYLLIGWARADQWLFVPAGQGRRIAATSNIAAVFTARPAAARPFPVVAGWCC